jgi:hypothetical protein
MVAPRTLLARPALMSESLLDNMVWIAGGTFLMGSDHHYREERPAHRVSVDGLIDRYEVTNGEFGASSQPRSMSRLRKGLPAFSDYPGASLICWCRIGVRASGVSRLSNPPVVALRTGRELAASTRAEHRDRAPGRSSGRAYRV